MRQFTIAAAVAVGLVALWAAVLPLTTAPATKQAAATSPAVSAALFPRRGRNGPDHALRAGVGEGPDARRQDRCAPFRSVTALPG